MATLISDGDFDTAAAAVEAPYGPLTRIGSVADVDPNSDLKVECTSALSLTVYLSYDEVNHVHIEEQLERLHSGRTYNAVALAIYDTIRVIYENAKSYSPPPFTDEEAQGIVKALQTIMPLVATLPNHSHLAEDTIYASFTVVDADGAGAGLDADVTNTTEGDVLMYLWDWGDGSVSIGASPANHTYSGAGAKTITLYAIGRGGYDRATRSVTIVTV